MFNTLTELAKLRKGIFRNQYESQRSHKLQSYGKCTTKCTIRHQQTGQLKSSSQWFSVQSKTA